MFSGTFAENPIPFTVSTMDWLIPTAILLVSVYALTHSAEGSPAAHDVQHVEQDEQGQQPEQLKVLWILKLQHIFLVIRL